MWLRNLWELFEGGEKEPHMTSRILHVTWWVLRRPQVGRNAISMTFQIELKPVLGLGLGATHVSSGL